MKLGNELCVSMYPKLYNRISDHVCSDSFIVRKCSEKLLAALEACWQDSILLTGLSDVIFKHASENFRVYVKYCSNQIYIDRTLKMLKYVSYTFLVYAGTYIYIFTNIKAISTFLFREQNSRFVEIVNQLESNSVCQSLNLHSFLMLPMQRITRMPLLIDAVLSKMDPLGEDAEYKTYQITLATLNKVKPKFILNNIRKFIIL